MMRLLLDRATCHPLPRRCAAALFSLFATFLVTANHAWAIPSGIQFEQMHHAQWAFKDGAPTSAWALAQTPDGILWIGASDGLHTFDGRSFRLYTPPGAQEALSTPVNAIWVANDRALWVSQNGWLTIIADGKASRVPSKVSVVTFAHGPDGRVWGATRAGVYAFQDKRWEPVGEQFGLPARLGTRQFFVDANGSLWLTSTQGLYVLDRGASRFESVRGGEGSGSLVFTRTAAFLTTERGLATVQGRAGERAVVPLFPLTTGIGLLLDKDGSLWLGAGNDLGRIPKPELLEPHQDKPPSQLQRFSRVQGLSGDVVNRLFEDREGNVWATTNGGIDRFRATKLTRLVAADAYSAAWAPDPDGSIWAATRAGRLYRIAGEITEIANTPGIFSMARDQLGRLWIGGLKSLSRLEQGVLHEIPLPPGAPGDVNYLVPMGGDAMLAILRGKAHFWSNGGWQDSLPFPGLPNAISTARRDPKGQTWIGQPDGGIHVVGPKGVTRLPPLDPTHPSPVLSFAFDGQLTWIGTETGLFVYDEGKFQTISTREGQPLRHVAGMEFADDGSLWIAAVREIAVVSADELRRVRSGRARAISVQRLDHNDGLDGTPPPVRPLPTVAKTLDGRLWFSTVRGLFFIDPKNIHRNPIAPSLSILSFEAGGRSQPIDNGAATQLDAGTRELRIAFTAFSLAVPERVQFKYLLDGVDLDWVDAGGVREARYANLAPGTYKFTVRAANEDGVWNDSGAVATFVIPPRFLQTVWFKALCVLLALSGLWLAYVMRMRQVRARMRENMQERLVERERIARELHDTLLQGIQGLVLRFQAVANKMPASDPVQVDMTSALVRADEVMTESRDRVLDMHGSAATGATLVDVLMKTGSELSREFESEFRMTTHGAARMLNRVAEDQVLQILREALLNAMKHARAARVDLELTFGWRGLHASVQDDGIGVAPEVLRDGRDGHLGIHSMRERAQALGATLVLRSTPGVGTRIDLKLRAGLAYPGRRRRYLAPRQTP